MESAAAVFRILFWCIALFMLAPRLLFRDGERALAADLLRMIAVTIVAVHILTLVDLYDVFSLTVVVWLLCVGLAAWQVHRRPLSGARVAWDDVATSAFSWIEFPAERRNAVVRWLRQFQRALRRPFHTPAAALRSIAVGLLIGAAAYRALAASLVWRTAGSSFQSNLQLVKQLDGNAIYADGVYPSGAHALISAIGRYALVDATLLLPIAAWLSALFMIVCVYLLVASLTPQRWPPLLAAAVYGLLGSGWLVRPLADQGDGLQAQVALGLFLLTTTVLVRYLVRDQPQSGWPVGAGVTAAFLTHPLFGVWSLIVIGAAIVAAWPRCDRRDRARAMVGMLAGGLLVALLIYAAGFARSLSISGSLIGLMSGVLQPGMLLGGVFLLVVGLVAGGLGDTSTPARPLRAWARTLLALCLVGLIFPLAFRGSLSHSPFVTWAMARVSAGAARAGDTNTARIAVDGLLPSAEVPTEASPNGYVLPRTAAPETSKLALLIPLYNYPNWYDPKRYMWGNVAAAARRVSITAIVNLNNGPEGCLRNGDYQRGVAELRAAGVAILGYVFTGYGDRPADAIKGDIDLWAQCYHLDGIFLDEAAHTSDKLNYYADLYAYMKQHLGLKMVVLNAGVSVDEDYVRRPVADTIVVFDNQSSKLPGYSPAAYTRNYPASRFAMVVHTVPDVATMRADLLRAVARRIHYVYLTNRGLPNPWESPPAFWNEEIDFIAALNANAVP